MKKIFNYWNKNRLKITITFIIIVFAISLIIITNNLLKQSIDENNYSETLKENTTSKIESVITDTQIPVSVAEGNEQIIAKFVENCNNRNYEQAYNMLTDECKNEQFRTLEEFIQNYCNPIFSNNRTYSLELWNTGFGVYTYRVLFYSNNILETGEFNSGNNFEDYITVLDDGETNAININGYIYMQPINKQQVTQNIEISVVNRHIYRDYEEYSITIVNNSNDTIRISDGKNSNDICLVDQNEVEYNAIMNEISVLNLEIQPGYRKNFTIRFNKLYNTYRIIDRIEFKNIILNINDEQSNAINIAIEI